MMKARQNGIPVAKSSRNRGNSPRHSGVVPGLQLQRDLLQPLSKTHGLSPVMCALSLGEVKGMHLRGGGEGGKEGEKGKEKETISQVGIIPVPICLFMSLLCPRAGITQC